MRSLIALSLVALLVLPLGACAAVPEANTTVRLEIAAAPPSSLWQRFVRLLGARRPAPGTTLAVTSTAYAPSPYQTDNTPCLTAAGTRVRPGTVAANWLPLGTLLNINGDVYIVEDRMHPRFQRSIDIFFPSTSQALEFGRRLLTVSIIGYGTPGQPIREESAAKPTAGKTEKQKTSAQPKKAPANKAQPKPAPKRSADVAGPAVQIVKPTLVLRMRLAWYSLRAYLASATARRKIDVNRFDVDCFADKSS